MTEKKPRRRIRIDRKGSAAPPAREVEIVHPDGRHERVSAARAARLVTSGEAQPGNWDRADLEAVADADAQQKQRQIETLRADGLLVGEDGAPGYVPPVPFSSLREMFRFWR